MRVASHHRASLRDTNLFKEPECFSARGGGRGVLVQADRFGDLLARREDGIERSHRLLKNHGHVRTADRTHQLRVSAVQVHQRAITAAQSHRIRQQFATALLNQSHQSERSHRFTRTGLANNRQRFAAINIKRQVSNRIDRAFRAFETNA